jgi:hypothetical protein
VKRKTPASTRQRSGKKGGVPGSAPLTLQETQTLFQDAILNQDDRVLGLLRDNSRTKRDTLFGVYQHGYAGRLVDILAGDYDVLRTYCGADEFEDLARSYIADHPSQTQNARWFGNGLPAYLAQDERYAGRPELSELADIERELSNAFDAADAPHVTLQDLAAIDPADWGRLTFEAHPSVSVLTLNSNAFAIWMAIKNDEAVPLAERIAGQKLVIVRQGATPTVREMSAEEAMMWTEACRGLRFEALCEMAAAYDDPEGAPLRAAGYLQNWLATEMLKSATVPPRQAVRSKKRRSLIDQ